MSTEETPAEHQESDTANAAPAKQGLNRDINPKHLLVTVLVAAMAAGGYFGYGYLQEQRELAQAQAPWRLQAESFAREFEMPPEKGQAFVDMYVARRTNFREKMANVADGDRTAWGLTFQRARQELRGRLSETFEGEQLDRTAQILLTFDQRYDDLVNNLHGLELSEDDFYAAMVHLHTFVYDLAKAQEQAFRQGARERLARMTPPSIKDAGEPAEAEKPEAPSPEQRAKQREAMQRMTEAFISTKKKQLDDALANILTEEQLARWMEVSTFDA